MSNQLKNKLLKLSGFIIQFLECKKPEAEPDSENWPDIRPEPNNWYIPNILHKFPFAQWHTAMHGQWQVAIAIAYYSYRSQIRNFTQRNAQRLGGNGH